MRNSPSIWDRTPRVGDLCWVKPHSGIRWKVGIVVSIEGFNYWDQSEAANWNYKVWVEGEIKIKPGWRVEKIPYICL